MCLSGKPPSDKLQIILEHLNLAIEDKGEKIAIKEMRKHIAWYLKGLNDASKMRDAINKIDNRQELENSLKEYFNNL